MTQEPEIQVIPRYTQVPTPGAAIITIEFIFGLTEDYRGELESALEVLRGVGNAAVVGHMVVAETYDEASTILAQRTLPEFP